MTGYPELNSNENVTVKTNDNKKTISSGYNSMRQRADRMINNALFNKVSSLKKEMSKIPEAYKKIRNNLTVSNNQLKKSTEEHIANTGNHTASGYAMSKRMNNNNEYLKEMNNINLAEKEKISDINNKIREAHTEAESERLKTANDFDYKELKDTLSEAERTDKLNFDIYKFNSDRKYDYDKLNEEKRVNNSKILKTENDIILDNAEDARKTDKHNLEMEYEPQIYSLKIDDMEKNNKLTDAKINKTNTEASKIKTTSSSTKSSGKTNPASKLTSKEIAASIQEQAGSKHYDEFGKVFIELDDFKAYTILMEWKNKFGLSDQVVNDTAIRMGIQGYL